LAGARWRLIHTDVSRDTRRRSRSKARPSSVYSTGRKHARQPSGSFAISYLSPLLAIIFGIVHASLAPVIVVGGVKPNLVLVAVVLVTALMGFLPGIVWAFAAGVTANLLVGDPLGAIPLSMLLVAVVVAAGARPFGRMVWIYPVIAAFAGSIVADLVLIGVGQLVGDAGTASFPIGIILSAAVLNAAITALALYPVRMLAGRYATDEAAAW
jgi:rod shape-determining protein MreD